MKKILAIFLLIVYGFTTIGATIHIHYCMGKYVSWSVTNEKKDTCGKCGMESSETKGCCSDQQRIFKINVDQSETVIFSPGLSFDYNYYINASSVYVSTDYLIPDEILPSTGSEPPNDLPDTRLHLLYCVFRI